MLFVNTMLKVIAIVCFAALFNGCTVVKIVDIAASTTVGAVKTTGKVAGKAVGAAIPDGDKKDKDASD